MRLISPGGENLLDFLKLRQVLSTSDGDLRDPLWWPQERPVPMRVARWPLGIPLPSIPGPKNLCGSVLEPEDSSPVLTWILGYFGVSPGESVLIRVGALKSAFLPSCSSSVILPVEWIKGSVAVPRGFPMSLSHEAFPQGCPTCHRAVSRSSA